MEHETARFTERKTCISCGGSELHEVCSGRYDEEPVVRYLANDPWGEHPAPFLRGHRWAYVRCASCVQAFHRYILAPEWNERRFTKWMSQEAIAAFEARIKTPSRLFQYGSAYTSHVLRLEALTRDLRGNGPVRVLDFGCGYGEFLAMCSLYGFEATGIDRSTARRENGRIPILPDLADVRGMQFHAVTMFEVLEHLDDPRAVLEELAQVLVPGGILVLETPNCEGVESVETLEKFRKIAPIDHINGFTPTTMQRFAEQLGFERITPPTAFATTELERLARNMVKRILKPVLKDNTQQYFRKVDRKVGPAPS